MCIYWYKRHECKHIQRDNHKTLISHCSQFDTALRNWHAQLRYTTLETILGPGITLQPPNKCPEIWAPGQYLGTEHDAVRLRRDESLLRLLGDFADITKNQDWLDGEAKSDETKALNRLYPPGTRLAPPPATHSVGHHLKAGGKLPPPKTPYPVRYLSFFDELKHIQKRHKDRHNVIVQDVGFGCGCYAEPACMAGQTGVGKVLCPWLLAQRLRYAADQPAPPPPYDEMPQYRGADVEAWSILRDMSERGGAPLDLDAPEMAELIRCGVAWAGNRITNAPCRVTARESITDNVQEAIQPEKDLPNLLSNLSLSSSSVCPVAHVADKQIGSQIVSSKHEESVTPKSEEKQEDDSTTGQKPTNNHPHEDRWHGTVPPLPVTTITIVNMPPPLHRTMKEKVPLSLPSVSRNSNPPDNPFSHPGLFHPAYSTTTNMVLSEAIVSGTTIQSGLNPASEPFVPQILAPSRLAPHGQSSSITSPMFGRGDFTKSRSRKGRPRGQVAKGHRKIRRGDPRSGSNYDTSLGCQPLPYQHEYRNVPAIVHQQSTYPMLAGMPHHSSTVTHQAVPYQVAPGGQGYPSANPFAMVPYPSMPPYYQPAFMPAYPPAAPFLPPTQDGLPFNYGHPAHYFVPGHYASTDGQVYPLNYGIKDAHFYDGAADHNANADGAEHTVVPLSNGGTILAQAGGDKSITILEHPSSSPPSYEYPFRAKELPKADTNNPEVSKATENTCTEKEEHEEGRSDPQSDRTDYL